MRLIDPRPLKAREQGASFDGFTNPTTGNKHFASMIADKDRTYALEALALKATSRRYVIKAPLIGADEGSFLPNTPYDVSFFLKKIAANLPQGADNRTKYFERFFFDEDGSERTGRALLPRVVVLPEADRYKIQKEFWGMFLFVMADKKEDVYPAIAKKMDTSVESILETARLNARFIAKERKTKTLQVYEEILKNAFSDSGLELHPLISMAPSELQKLMLRTYMYLLLAKPKLNPDFMIEAINGLACSAPDNFHPPNDTQRFKTKEADGIDGFSQLLYEAALTTMDVTTKSTNGMKGFRQCQKEVEMIQFMEDVALLIRHFGVFASELMSEGETIVFEPKSAK